MQTLLYYFEAREKKSQNFKIHRRADIAILPDIKIDANMDIDFSSTTFLMNGSFFDFYDACFNY